ncbi:MAG: hypothetical protein ACLGHC_06745, partial [Alphaproteobacteria bacterium]
RLGRELAEAGTITALLPLIQQKETEELVAAHTELSEADKAALRATAKRVYETGRERLLSETGRAYAERLSITDLRRLVRFSRTSAAKRYRDATPAVIAATLQAVGTMDFKKDVRAAFCKETGKLCEPK